MSSRPRRLSDSVSTTEPLDHKETEETEEELAVSVLRYLASQVVDDVNAITIKRETTDDGKLHLTLQVADEDMGKVIGRKGRVAYSIRTIVRAAGAREGFDASVEIVER
ncbi:MAG: KH domain-containing protein [Actinomycetota bacterium]|nr:MAG: KH domain-containing protein [Actinomycetota bacterium]